MRPPDPGINAIEGALGIVTKVLEVIDMSHHPNSEPFQLFQEWYGEAEAKEPNDPNAMALATVGADGQPSVRMVLLKDSCWRRTRPRSCCIGSRSAARCAPKARW